MKNFTTQSEFFQKLDTQKYHKYENELCGIINIFLVLKELGGNMSEAEIFERGINRYAFDSITGWDYYKMVSIFEHFAIQEKIDFTSIEVNDSKLFHNRKLKKEFSNFENKIYLASVKLEENHIIIIDAVDYNNVYYTSVGTREFDPVVNNIVKIDDFLDIYNGRGIMIKL